MKRMNYVVNKAKVAGIIAAAALVMAPVCVMADETAAPVSVETEVQAEDTAAASTVDVTAPTSSEDQTAPATSEDQTAPVSSEDQTAPATSEDQTAPVSSEDQTAPASSEDKAAPATDTVTPAAETPAQAPAAETPAQAPAAQEEKAPYVPEYTNKATFNADNGGWYQVKEYVLWGRQITGVKDNGEYEFGPWEKAVVKSGGDIRQELGKHYDEYAFDLDVMWGTDHPYSNVFWRATDGNAQDIDISWGGTVRSVNIDISVNGRQIYHETNCASHSAFNGN